MATPTARPPQGPSYAPPRRARVGPRTPSLTAYVASVYDVERETGCFLVQRISLPDIAEQQSWTVLGADWLPVIPVEAFLAHLTDQRRS